MCDVVSVNGIIPRYEFQPLYLRPQVIDAFELFEVPQCISIPPAEGTHHPLLNSPEHV